MYGEIKSPSLPDKIASLGYGAGLLGLGVIVNSLSAFHPCNCFWSLYMLDFVKHWFNS